jgi:hypothetical protein
MCFRGTNLIFFLSRKKEMAETDRDEVVSMLRACLISSKWGIPLSNLNRK